MGVDCTVLPTRLVEVVDYYIVYFSMEGVDCTVLPTCSIEGLTVLHCVLVQWRVLTVLCCLLV